jgi:hypothetical protein
MPRLRSGMDICGFDRFDFLHVSDRDIPYPETGKVSPKKML